MSLQRKIIRKIRWALGVGFAAADLKGQYETHERDAWGYDPHPDTANRFERILAALPPGPIGRALEVGCAEGHLTRQFAPKVGQLLSVDIVDEAIRRAKAACSDLPNVGFQVHDVRGGFPEGRFDLLLFSDVLYYFSKREITTMISSAAEVVNPGGSFVVANGWMPNYTGLTNPDIVLEALRSNLAWREVKVSRGTLGSGMALITARFERA